MPLKLPITERFWRHVDKSGECWTWTAATTGFGYGLFAKETKHRYDGPKTGVFTVAHRFSWEEEHGPIPPGMVICHKCDNPPCVRPEHLFIGTQADNLRDMAEKGKRKGVKHHMVKLTEAQVLEIRDRWAKGEMQKHLGPEFGVDQSNISSIIRRNSWRHI